MFFSHNIETYEKFKPMLLKYHECCLVATMGVGKTDISMEFIKEFSLNTLVILPNTDLRKEWEDLANLNGFKTLSTITYHSFSNCWAVMNGFDCYIFDEAHHMDSRVWGKSIRRFRENLSGDVYIIGLTGDSIRYFDNYKDVAETMFHGHVVYGHSQYEAIEQGILPPADYVCAIFDTNGLYEKYSKKATTRELKGRLDFVFRNAMPINDILLKYAPEKVKGIVFVDRIDSIEDAVKTISKAFPNENIRFVHSKLPKREVREAISAFKKDETGFMVAVNIFNEGYHIPGVNTIIMLRATKSPSVYAQQMGRGFSAKSKTRSIIFDFVGNNISVDSIDRRMQSMVVYENNPANKRTNNHNISKQAIVYDHARDILQVMAEIDIYNSRSWSKEEDDIIREFYPTMGYRVYKKLPGRSKSACQNRAIFLGVHTNNIWTEKEDEILRELYPTMGGKVYEKLPGRTRDACLTRAKVIGLQKCNSWTEKEDDIIREFYPTMGSNVYEKLPGRSKVSCYARAQTLNVSSSKLYRSWTEKEDEILRELYPTMGGKVYEKLPGRTKAACYYRANILGLR